MCCGDKVLRIQDIWVVILKIRSDHRIHVVDYDPILDLAIINAKIATVVSNDDLITD